jgi:hypothetical protein
MSIVSVKANLDLYDVFIKNFFETKYLLIRLSNKYVDLPERL